MHRKRFQIYWRGRSCCPGRPKTSGEICGLIGPMSLAYLLWTRFAIHSELLKLSIEVNRTTRTTSRPISRACSRLPEPEMELACGRGTGQR
jgi:hypothetical protein